MTTTQAAHSTRERAFLDALAEVIARAVLRDLERREGVESVGQERSRVPGIATTEAPPLVTSTGGEGP